MAEVRERRGAPRVVIPGRVGSRVRATIEARLLDLSIIGARIQHQNLLRPGFTCILELPSALGAHSLAVRVVRSTVVGTEPNEAGERLLRYESGLAFVDISEAQQIDIKIVLERLTPGGGLGDGRLVL